MKKNTRIIALAGSLRANSYNKQLVRVASAAAVAQGADVIDIDLADYDIPLFSEDLEAEGVPESVVKLKAQFREADGLLIASPEYNGSISGVLKNVLDWLSRPDADYPGSNVFAERVVGLLAASPGALGGLRGLTHVTDIFGNLGSIVLPGQVALPKAYNAFDAAGDMIDSAMRERVAGVGRRVVEVASAVAGINNGGE